MNNITLVCTEHSENGKCTSCELCNILERIKPEIIFEEIPPSLFNEYYKDKSRYNLETNAINMYLENHQVNHIPVDFYDIPEKFFKENGYMHKRINSRSREYKTLIDTKAIYVQQYGFKYLNSIYCMDIYSQIYQSMYVALKKIDDKKLIQIYESWNNVMEKRENEMIKNIYTYSKEHEYNMGVFFIGAAHRKSIIQLIEKSNNNESVKINWNYSNYGKIL